MRLSAQLQREADEALECCDEQELARAAAHDDIDSPAYRQVCITTMVYAGVAPALAEAMFDAFVGKVRGRRWLN